MKEPRLQMKMAVLARLSGTPRTTIHHYENVGLLPPPVVLGPKLHLFGPEHLACLREIKRLRRQGLSLRAIKPRLARTAAARPARAHRASKSEPARTRILQHAAEQFVRLGYERTKLDDLASDLQMAKATIYRHFPSKQALFVECVEQIRYTLIPRSQREQSEQQPRLVAQARDRVRAVLQNFSAYRGLTSLLGAVSRDADARLSARAKRELHSMITNAEPLLRVARGAGMIRPLDTELLAYMLWGALMGAGERLLLDDRYGVDEVLEVHLDFIAHGIALSGWV